MSTALWLLAILGALGAFDTLYYREGSRCLIPFWAGMSAASGSRLSAP